MGYHRAGFEVVGVDIAKQPHYPFEFRQADALTYPLDGFDAIHASPPCQRFSRARLIHGVGSHEDLLTPTRDRLQRTGTSWVIENVPGSPMRRDLVLCGSMFGYPRLQRHRWFEFGQPMPFTLLHPCAHADEIVSVFGHGGHVYHGVADWRKVMGIDWMTRAELAQAIPPAYTEWVGLRLLEGLAAGGTSPRPSETHGAVSLDFAGGDDPRLADEARPQAAVGDLAAQRGSRHPESDGGFGEGEHLAAEFGPRHALGLDTVWPRGVDGPAGDTDAVLAASGVAGRAPQVLASSRLSERLDGVLSDHRVLLRGGHAPNLRDAAQDVKGSI